MKNKQNEASRRILELSQEENFPYQMKHLGLDLIIHENVFSPKHFNGHDVFTRNFPPFQDEEILEIGCGCGNTGLYLAKNGASHVTLVDINPYAVENTRENAKRNNITNCDVFQSDIFSSLNLQFGRRFDTIYWNMPFGFEEEDYQFRSMLERALFDPGYRTIKKLLQEAPSYLKEDGRLLIGWGDSEEHDFGNPEDLEKFAKEYNFSIKLVAEEESIEENPVKFLLYELRRLN